MEELHTAGELKAGGQGSFTSLLHGSAVGGAMRGRAVGGAMRGRSAGIDHIQLLKSLD